MSIYALQYNLTFESEQCCKCHAPFMMTSDAQDSLRSNHKSFWCPYCGTGQHYTGKTEEQKLKEQLIAERNRKEAALRRANEERQRADRFAQKAKVSQAARLRLKNRIKNGVCPCCNRTFTNLYRHIQAKHKDWYSKESLKEMRTEMELTQSDLAAELDIPSGYVSNYENGKYLPVYAKEIIDGWINEQALNEVRRDV